MLVDALYKEADSQQYTAPYPGVPCFYQVDLLIRSLFADKDADFCPKFIVILPLMDESSRGHVLFRRPELAPPASLLADWPTTCGQAHCSKADCSLLDLSTVYSLAPGSSLVRADKRDTGFGKTFCNRWGCEKEHNPQGGKTLLSCQKCKEVVYCGAGCQVFMLTISLDPWMYYTYSHRGPTGPVTKSFARNVRIRKLGLCAIEILLVALSKHRV